MPRYEGNRQTSSPVPRFDLSSTIARTTRQPIAEGALLRPKFSATLEATRGVSRRPKLSAEEGKNRPKGDSRLS